MIRIVSIALFALAVLLVSQSDKLSAQDEVKLSVGDKAPVFESVDDQGKVWKSSDHVGKKTIVIYFYPGDLTGSLTKGCTSQACGYRDDMKKLTDKDVEIVGISGDSVKNHQLFKAVHKLNFTLLADEKGTVAKKFGVPTKAGFSNKTKDENGNPVELTREVFESRWTFVIGKDGKIAQKNTKVDAAQDSKKVLEVLEKGAK